MNTPNHRRGDRDLSRWVGFEAAGQPYAFDIAQVHEVLSQADIEPIPGAAPGVLGVMNLRGRIVTVLDLRICLGYAEAAGAKGCVIVIDAHTEVLGVQVDRIADICSIAASAIKPLPASLGAPPAEFVRGVVTRQDSMLTLLDAERLSRQFRAKVAAAA